MTRRNNVHVHEMATGCLLGTYLKIIDNVSPAVMKYWMNDHRKLFTRPSITKTPFKGISTLTGEWCPSM